MEAIFAILFIMTLSLGIVQVALSLYGRNVVISSTHEGARAAVEVGGDVQDAVAVAEQTVRDATGRLVNDLAVEVSVDAVGDDQLVTVRASGTLHTLGPFTFPVPVVTTATALRPGPVR